ncbi:peptidyl-prolyl cis-trans isomerase [Roseomonas sp. HJA6]|uniref:Parvulin-like PPIase n=1 Tax=Roseomonas alba TaxID=2846776 RepID=A0ABS7AC70_9PROT|nr:peptidyl-prolyl cis-trans isomerase [Neoroseomonas alba]MBW6399895.1 peptidyl-prolyl cis-trans isomerase [Neoroseomonas alba]
MLTAMRRLAGTWPARLLFLLLLASFLVWGIEDIVRNFGRDTAVARVGDESIELPEAQAAARREMARIARQLGNRFEPNEDIRRAVAATALERLIAQYALRNEANHLGLAAPAPVVRDAVFAIPGLRGADGSFSRLVFDSFLRNNDLSEAQFLRVMSDEVLREQLSGAIRSGAAAPQAMSGPLLAWAFERRSAEVVQIARAAMPEPEAPTEAQLRRFQENNAPRFSAPEYREAAVLVLNAETLASEVQVDDAALQAAYDARRAQFDTPEKRIIYQAVVPQEAQARAIAEAWRGGADLAAIEAQARADDGGAADLGPLERSQMPHAAVRDAAFAAPQGGVTDPIQSPFGWHVIRVERIEPAVTRTFEQVRDQLRQELAHERALDLAYERANRVEDALAGGAGLAEAAERFGLTLATATLSATGQDQEGQPATLPVPEAQRPELLRAIFAARPGDPPRMSEMGDAFVAIEIRQVIAPALRPFEAVESAVRDAWVVDARRREAEERAAALMAAVRGGKTMEEAATEAGLTVQAFGPFSRDPALAGELPRELVAPIFELKVGEVTMAPTQAGFAVARLTAITPFDATSDEAAIGRVRAEVEQQMQDELEEQFARAIRDRANVRINSQVLDQVTGR